MADYTKSQATLVVTNQTTDVALTLNPTNVYELHNLGAYAVYGSTDGSAVVVSDATAAHKFKSLAPTAGYQNMVTRFCGVTTLNLKSVTGAGLVVVTVVGVVQ